MSSTPASSTPGAGTAILAGAAGQRLVHRADRAADAHAGTAPTLPAAYDLSALRLVASVGEPLNPEVVVWGTAGARPAGPRQLVADRDRRDHDRQLPRPCEIRPGSMGPPAARRRGRGAGARRGRPGPRSSTAQVTEVAGAGVGGELALRPGWPSMFRGYLHDEERYRACFAGGWYLTGDLARRRRGRLLLVRRPGRRRDQVGRAPDRPVRGRERADGAPGGGRGRRDRQARPGRRRGRQGVRVAAPRLRAGPTSCAASCSPSAGAGSARLAPQEIAFDQHLPHTRSGKVMRRLLKARELGLPEGDLSTLEQRPAGRAPAAPARRARAPATRPQPATGCCCSRCCGSAGSRSAAPSSTAPPGSAASCTSTSARRPSPPG